MTDKDDEKDTLRLALPVLERLYGRFTVDPAQTESPDAALILASADGEREAAVTIGIEVTSIDPFDVQKYLNDGKTHRDEVTRRLEAAAAGQAAATRAVKKALVSFSDDYIAKGALLKAKLYDTYASKGFAEVALLVTSEFLLASHPDFHDYLVPWADYRLSQAGFPFGAVIFVCKTARQAFLVYDLNSPVTLEPAKPAGNTASLEVAVIHGSFGAPLNINAAFEQEPAITMGKPKRVRK